MRILRIKTTNLVLAGLPFFLILIPIVFSDLLNSFSVVLCYLFIIAIVTGISVYSLNRNIGYFYILLLLIPLCVGNYSGHQLLASSILIPFITGLLFILRLSALPFGKIVPRLFSANSIFVCLYFLVIFLNFLRRPPSISGFSEGPQSFYVWFRYIVCFCAYIFFALYPFYSDPDTIRKQFSFAAKSCVFLCAFGLVLLFSYSLQDIWIEISNRGAFYNLFGGWEAFPHYKSPPWGYRIGGIPDFAAMGILLFLSGYKKINKKITLMALLFFLFCTIISGGRTAFISILMVITLWALFEKKYMIVALLLILFAISIGGIVMFFEYLPGSIKRISNIVGNLENLDTGRSLLFPIFFQRFKENPLFGTGIGSLSLSWQDIENYRSSFETFVIVNLKAGGHGTFLSLLYLFGLSGFIPFVLSLLFGIRTSFKLYKASQCNETLRSIALCCLLYLLNAIIPMLFGGSGSEPQYFVALGILSGTATEFALKRDSQPGFSTPVRIT